MVFSFDKSTMDPYKGQLAPTVIALSFTVSSATAFIGLNELELPPQLANGGHYQFLTNIALLLSTIYSFVNILYHQTSINGIKPLKIHMSAICLSLNVVVSLVYWSLKLFIPHLIMAEKDGGIPLLLDIQIHMIPLLTVAIDYFCFMERWNVPFLRAYAIVASLTTLYWFWLEYLITDGASYPYPFLNVEKNLRIIIFIIVSFIAFSAFVVGKLLHPQFIPELKEAEKHVKNN